MYPRRLYLLTIVLVLLFRSSAHAQTAFGSIVGSVTDSSGAVIPDAQVSLLNLSTSEKRTQPTGTDGLYSFVNLIPGQYRIDVEKGGFKHFAREPIVVQVQQTSRIDVAMQVGEVSETLNVTAETPLLQSETSSLGQVISERSTTQLPLNGRNVFNLITLAPAVVPQGSSGGTPVGVNPFGWGNYQVNGSFGNQSAEYLDGQPLNIGYINLPVLIPTQDSVQEFKVQTSNLGPEWGKFSGGVTTLNTKSGSNLIHGSAYEFLRNKVLNANDFFNNKNGIERPPFTQNQFGVNGGGPVYIPNVYDGRDKTFWFFGYEGFRLRTGQTFTATVPSSVQRAGDFSALCKSGFDANGLCNDRNSATGARINQIFDPCAGNVNAVGACPGSTVAPAPFARNIIPVNRINPTSKALLNLWPAPTGPGDVNNFNTSTSTGGNQYQIVSRVDHNLTNKQRLFGRYSHWDVFDLPIDPLGTGLCADRCSEKYVTDAAAVGYNYAITPTTILDVNASLSRFKYNRNPINSGFDLTTIGWPASYNDTVPSIARTPPTPCVANFADNIICSQGQSFIQDRNTQFNISPSMTMIRGRHTYQFGGQFQIGYDNYAQTNVASGAFAFCVPGQPCFTGFSFADFLLGYADNPSNFSNHFFGQAVVPALTAGKQFYRAFHFGDTWHATNKLTLNLGLRYEVQGPWSERFDRLTYFDANARSFLAERAGLPGLKGDAFLVNGPGNSTRNNIRLDKKNFAPRIGLAYSLDPKTVIRSGYGIFWIPNYVSFGLNPLNDHVNAASTSFTGTLNGIVPINTISLPFPAGIAPPPGRNLGPDGTQLFLTQTVQSLTQIANLDDHPSGYVQQWNFNIQRELPKGFFVSAAYAGSKGTHLQSFAQQVNQLSDNLFAQAAAQSAAGQPVDLLREVPNPFFINGESLALSGPTTTQGQLLRPFPQYTGVALAGQGSFDSSYHSFQLTVQRRFADAGSLLVAYTNAKLISNTDTLTSWLESSVGAPQDNNNLRGDRSLSSQDVPQRLVISYVLDLPFGRGKRFLSGASGITDKLVSGWGINGVTTFQKGFPLVFSNGLPNGTTLFGAGSRPNVVSGCDKSLSGSRTARLNNWFNTSCFTAPADFTFGNEPRVDSTLRSDGINNFDFAVFKRTKFGPNERLGAEFRAEFFNLFNRAQFAAPNSSVGQLTFGQVTSTASGTNPRLIQFALRLLF